MQPLTKLLHSTAALLLILIVLAGLLSFPTSCGCGIDLPHEHSLFLVNQHRHQEALPSEQHPADSLAHAGHRSAAEDPAQGFDYDGPQLRGPSTPMYAGDQAPSLVTPTFDIPGEISTMRWSFNEGKRTGHVPVPDHPPPKG